MAILAVLLAVAVPAWDGLNERWRLEGAAWRLASEMRLARQLAISSGEHSRFEFRWHSGCYLLILPEERKKIALPEGISFAYSSFRLVDGVCRFSISSLGAPSPAGTVGLQNRRGDRLHVIITPATGRVRVSPEHP